MAIPVLAFFALFLPQLVSGDAEDPPECVSKSSLVVHAAYPTTDIGNSLRMVTALVAGSIS
jgi:ribulose 1,5-bisphosphate carboxylase large subunit-like protein